MTFNFLYFTISRECGSGQFLHMGQFYLSPGLAKITPWLTSCREIPNVKPHPTMQLTFSRLSAIGLRNY